MTRLVRTAARQRSGPPQPTKASMVNHLALRVGGFILLSTIAFSAPPAQAAPIDIELGSGDLGPGRFGLFAFSIDNPVRGAQSLVLSSAGSSFDTEIAVYDATGRMLATNDDAGSGTKTSLLSFGGARELAAGAYTAVISGFNSIFRNGDIVPGSHRGGHYRLGIQASQPVSTPQAPDYLAADGNLLTAAIKEIELGSGWLGAGAIRRMTFTLTDDIGAGDWLAIHTAGSGIDTEIALYDAQGELVATNDDVNSQTRTSRLAFGLDGDNGRALPAGEYTLLLGGFNTIFEDGTAATSGSTTAGTYSVHIQRTAATPPVDIFIEDPAVVAEPSPFALSGIALALAFAARRRRPSSASGMRCIRNDISVS
ncbi:MAG: DVUA0089 family protein [Burkholderiales bacterium]|nr:DVUA0089 family protein [Burkholderiales bacterium]